MEVGECNLNKQKSWIFLKIKALGSISVVWGKNDPFLVAKATQAFTANFNSVSM